MYNLTPEEKAIGRENFQAAVGSEFTRRDFLKGALAATAVTAGGVGAMYYGYDREIGNPVRAAVIGTGDEGGVLIGAHTPDFVQVVAICDIRPYNIHRAFHGDETNENTKRVRPGLLKKYGWKTQDEAEKHIKVTSDYKDILNNEDVEAVIIALPLHLHAQVAIEAMRKGKHVLTEKLMGHDVAQCKEMSRVSFDTGKLLATGHQRHYSVLYDNAVNLIQRGLIGDVHHIRAQWHRGNLPGRDSWSPPMPDQLDSQVKQLDADLAALTKDIEKMTGQVGKGVLDGLLAQQRTLGTRKKLLELQAKDGEVDATKYGYQAVQLASGTRPPLEELIRWRLWNRTGGGLMAELGSHQLDASGIFVSAVRNDGKKVHPLSVAAVGGRYIFPLDRECEDQVFSTYEFPGPDYEKDPNKKIVVTYSSINGNGFGGYGEVVMGTKGTLILEREEEVMLFREANTSTRLRVAAPRGGRPCWTPRRAAAATRPRARRCSNWVR